MPDTNSILGAAGDIGSILAAIAANRAKGRVDEAGVNQNQGRAEADIFRTRMASAIGGPAAEAKNTALGDTLANVQPFSWTGGTSQVGNIPVPQATGGLTPGNYGPATRAAGAALASQSAGRVTDPAFALPTPPVIAPVPQAGALDSILGAAGGIGSLAGALGKGGADSGGNLLGLGKELIDKYRHRNDNIFGGQTSTSNTYDPSFYDPENPDASSGVLPDLPGAGNYGLGSEGPPTVDPSLATDYDPMEEYRRWLESQNQAGGAGGNITGTDWGDE
jgi:hypothetical protein